MSRPLLLVGGPLELDDTEIPDNFGTIRTLKDQNGCEHMYYVIRDWALDRWVGKYQRPVKEIAK
jgi:hypothetical protein